MYQYVNWDVAVLSLCSSRGFFVNGLYAHNYSEVNALARICQCIYSRWYSSYKGTSKVSINLSFDVYSPRRVNFCGLPAGCRDNRSLQGEQMIVSTCDNREYINWGVLNNTNNVCVSIKVFIQNNSDSRILYRINYFSRDNWREINFSSFEILWYFY